jgi:hypothetical protein
MVALLDSNIRGVYKLVLKCLPQWESKEFGTSKDEKMQELKKKFIKK